MKRLLFLLLSAALMLGILSGCGEPAPEVPPEGPSMTLRIIEGSDTGDLILAGERPGDIYTLCVPTAELLTDAKSQPLVLRDGMLVDVFFGGDIAESFPAQLGGDVALQAHPEAPGALTDQLIPLYLQVLEDLWAVDPGLNEDITYLSLDLSQAPGELTEGEQDALAWIFACRHGAEPLTLGMDALAEAGYLLELPHSNPMLQEGQEPLHIYQWDDGILFSIQAAQDADGAPLAFHAEKWRSPTGSYVFHNCTVNCGNSGGLSYTVGGEMIS